MHFDAFVVEWGDAKRLAEALEEAFPNAHRYTANSGDTEVLVFEEAYLRSASRVTAIVVLDRQDSTSCRVETVTCGGGVGTGGTEKATMSKTRRLVEGFALGNAMKVRTADSRFSSGLVGNTPRSFLRKCIKCGELIPLASEECRYCGEHQPVG